MTNIYPELQQLWRAEALNLPQRNGSVRHMADINGETVRHGSQARLQSVALIMKIFAATLTCHVEHGLHPSHEGRIPDSCLDGAASITLGGRVALWHCG